MTYQCPRCQERGQSWKGDTPKCGFDQQGNFHPDNWNCATLNALRELAEPNAVWCNDNNMAIVSRDDIGFGILGWYKNRGTTDTFHTGDFVSGNLKYAQQLLGDIEPDYSHFWD